ncbi:MAG TPA: hypothetical protein VF614_14605 [Chthoniobacteraceae bacterium]|jgi:hypothetical protein
MKARIVWLLVILLSSLTLAQEPATFTSKPFSLTVSAPLGWKLVPADFRVEEYAVRKDLLEVVTSRRNVPIVRVAKPVAGNATITPVVQIFVVPAEGSTPKLFLWSQTRTAEAGFEDFRITQAPSETELAGTKCAMIESTFVTPYPGGRRFPTLSRVWAVPRDKMIFVVSLTGQPNDLKTLGSDIAIILKSIRFTTE